MISMKKMILNISILFILISSLTLMTVAFLLDQDIEEDTLLIGDVSVSALVYYEKDGIEYPIEEVVIDQNLNIKKNGIYQIGVTDSQAIEFIENLRIKFFIQSDFDTYLRVSIIESLVLTTENFEGVRTEIPVIAPPSDFFFDNNDWFYNDSDNFHYLKHSVQRIDENTPNEVVFIGSYFPGASFSPRPLGYTLQIGLRIQAVQAIQGPQIRWGLETPPWGGNWT
jgi:hypothetical protein